MIGSTGDSDYSFVGLQNGAFPRFARIFFLTILPLFVFRNSLYECCCQFSHTEKIDSAVA